MARCLDFLISGHFKQWKYAKSPTRKILPKLVQIFAKFWRSTQHFAEDFRFFAKVAKYRQIWSHCLLHRINSISVYCLLVEKYGSMKTLGIWKSRLLGLWKFWNLFFTHKDVLNDISPDAFFTSVTRWLNYFSMFGHFQHWQFAQYLAYFLLN